LNPTESRKVTEATTNNVQCQNNKKGFVEIENSKLDLEKCVDIKEAHVLHVPQNTPHPK
jgi:hypothetical protein